MKAVKVDFFGTFWSVKTFVLDPTEWLYFNQIAAKIKTPLEEAITDPFFYHHLRLQKYQSFLDLKGDVFTGTYTTKHHQIEVWFENKRMYKIKIQDLHPSQILFPIFKTIENTHKIPEFSGLHIEFIETGKISKTMMIENNFLPELLTFELFTHQEHLFFGDVFYGDKKLKNRKSDTLLNRAVGRVNSSI